MSRNEYDINKSKTGLTTHAFSTKGRVQNTGVGTDQLEKIRVAKEKAAAEKAALDAQSESEDTTDTEQTKEETGKAKK